MPYLQFLNNSRDQEFEQLNENASLVVGSGADAHIKVTDPGVEGRHATVYPAQGSFWLQDMGAGSTVFKMQRLQGNTQGLQPGDVFILGTTFVKFWQEKPAGGGGGGDTGGGGGADPAALQAAQTELAAAKAELETLRGSGGQHEQRAQQLEGQLSEVQGQLQAAQQELASSKERASALEGELAEAQDAVESAKQAAAQERADVEAALQAARAQLEGLQGDAQGRERDSFRAAAEPSDLDGALEALRLADPVRRRLEAAVAAEVEREVLRRLQGPVVPLRGFRLAGSDRDLEAEVTALRRKSEHVQVARDLDLGGLPAEELERLLGLARS